MTSIFRWEGKVEHATEHVLIAKTTSEKMEALRAEVLALHPYSLPCIVALPLDATTSHAPFLQWIAEETAKPASHEFELCEWRLPFYRAQNYWQCAPS